MKPLRYALGITWVGFIWVLIAGVVGFGIPELLGIPQAFRNYAIAGCLFLGTTIGFFAARQSWITHVRVASGAEPNHFGSQKPHGNSQAVALFALVWSLPSGLSAVFFYDLLQRGAGIGALCGAMVFPVIHIFLIIAAVYSGRTERKRAVASNPK